MKIYNTCPQEVTGLVGNEDRMWYVLGTAKTQGNESPSPPRSLGESSTGEWVIECAPSRPEEESACKSQGIQEPMACYRNMAKETRSPRLGKTAQLTPVVPENWVCCPSQSISY